MSENIDILGATVSYGIDRPYILLRRLLLNEIT